MFTLGGGWKRKGEQDLRDVFGDTIEKFPRGVVEKTMFFNIMVRYIPSTVFHVAISADYRGIDGYNFIPEKVKADWHYQLLLSIRPHASFVF